MAMIGGVLYREFTKLNGFTAWTTLFVVHTHYFILGMMFFLILVLISMDINLKINRAVLFYNIGLNLTAIMLVVLRLKCSICSYFWYCGYWSYYSGCFISYDFIGNKKERLSSFSLPLTCRLGKCLARMYLHYS